MSFTLKVNNITVQGNSYKEAFDAAGVVPESVGELRVIDGSFTMDDLSDFKDMIVNCSNLDTLVFEEEVSFETNRIYMDMFGRINCITLEFACSSLDTVDENGFSTVACDKLVINKITRVSMIAFSEANIKNVEANCVSSLSQWSFWHSYVRSVVMPSVETVPGWCFCEAFYLETVTFGKLSRIDVSAFDSCQNLAKIDCTFAPEITVGDRAFYACSGLGYFNTIFLTNISNSCFERCYSLSNVDLTNVEVIEASAFWKCCNLTEIYAPKLQLIRNYGFFGCFGLTSVVCEKLAKLETSCFKDCVVLENITAGEVVSIGTSAFENCDELKNIDWTLAPNIKIKHDAFQSCQKLEKLDIGLLKYATEYCFRNCQSLLSVNLSSVRKIEVNAFAGCYSLTEIVAPEATVVMTGAFAFCLSVVEVNMPRLKNITSFSFSEMPSLVKIAFPAAERMENECFRGCHRLYNVSLSVETIGNENFRHCHSLVNVELDRALSLGVNNFINCTNIRNVSVNGLKECQPYAFASARLHYFSGESLTEVPERCFYKCQRLKKVEIPNCEIIGLSAFEKALCEEVISLPELRIMKEKAFYNSLEISLLLGPGLQEIGDYALAEIDICNIGFTDNSTRAFECETIGKYIINGTVLCYGGVCVDTSSDYAHERVFAYFNASVIRNLSAGFIFPPNWKNSCLNISFPNLETVKEKAFSNWSSLVSIDLPALRECYEGMFDNCAELCNVSLGSLTHIYGGVLFSGCPKLTHLELPSLIQMCDGAFSSLPDLQKVMIPICNSITDSAFTNCSGLVSVHAPMVSVISPYAFSGCRSLLEINGDKTVDIQGVTSIGVSAFTDCASIREIKLGEVKEIKNCTFSRCESLVSISVEHVQDLYASAFEDCSSLQSLNFQNLVSLYGDRQFANCVRLESIHTPKLMNVYSDHAQEIFANCSSLGSIFLGSDPPEFNENVFLNTNRGYIEIDGEKFVNLTLCVEGHDYSKYQSECDSEGKDCESFRWNGLYANQDEDYGEVCGIPGKSWFARNLYWFIPALIASVCAAVICVGVFLYIRKHKREKDEMYRRLALSRLVLDDFG